MLISLEDLLLLIAFKSLPKSISVRYPYLSKDGLYIHEIGDDGKQGIGCFYSFKENRLAHCNTIWKEWVGEFINSNLKITSYLQREFNKNKNESLCNKNECSLQNMAYIS